MIQNEYLIQELAEKAGVSLRTIRYYQQEGLLPEPINRGKFAYYNDDHLDRLMLIQELKKNYLPLKEIREQINTLTPKQVQFILDSHKVDTEHKTSMNSTFGGNKIQPGSTEALDYISRLLNTQSESRDPGTQNIQAQTHRQIQNVRYVAGTPSESWQRIIVAPGIEVHYHEPLSPGDRKHLEELIILARKIFLK
jgi:DNA-binding transcriptional MerR regulator